MCLMEILGSLERKWYELLVSRMSIANEVGF